MKRIITAATIALSVSLAMAGCSISSPSLPVSAPSIPAPTAPTAPAVPAAPAPAPALSIPSTSTLDLLGTLAVKGKAPMTGYDRKGMFGSPWLDTDRNGCDQRNDILARDLTEEILEGRCKVLSGSFADPYTGTSILFVRGNTTSTLVQIDHVVALGNAWETGAQQLTQEQRIAFANDALNLRAADGPTNSAKGKGDTATWLPPNKGFRCEYVALQVQVKAKYALWVTQAERDAMARVLEGCGGVPIAAAPATPAPAPVAAAPAPAPAPDPAPEVGAVPVYENCTAVRAAGAAPITAADPGWQQKFDRDGDGVACE